jgi:cobyrinic acid a,c-diamide synthase
MTKAPGLIVAGTASGGGKTVVTLGLLRAFARAGTAVAPFKTGPDYIDAGFHRVAAGRDCVNLDPWAMRPATLRALFAHLARDAELVLGEGVMGLFDGAADGTGSTADLAVLTGWPVILVADARGQGASAAAVLRGFAGHREDVALAGVVFNRVGGERHERMLREACEAASDVPVLGCVPRDDALGLPSRHLGLVQAGEHADLDRFIDAAADAVERALDVRGIARLARRARSMPGDADPVALPPPGMRIALARDDAFAFSYPWVIEGWRRAGAEIVHFSPLADEAPDAAADAVFLPGGYPELHAGRIAANRRFLEALRAAAARGAAVLGECGGYMVLGEGLTDADGVRHVMAGLLPLETSFADRRLHLGYRRATLVTDGPLGAAGARFRGHEFHYATMLREDGAAPLFSCADAEGHALPAAGCVSGRVMGSFIHLIDRAGGDGTQ